MQAARLVGAFLFHVGCVALMVTMALWAEQRPSPSLPDVVISAVPYSPWVDRWNYLVWTAAYLPVAIVFLFRDLPRFTRYLIAGGWLSLVRGVCIAVTGLGPVQGGAALPGARPSWRALVRLTAPFGGFLQSGSPLCLTKDLFFSGHTATTFLLLLYVWRDRALRGWMLLAHVLVVISVFWAHLHYTIDVIGAYAITFCVYVLIEGNPRQLLSGARTA